MMRRHLPRHLLRSSLAALLAAGLSVPALAQQQNRTADNDQRQRSGQDQPSQRRDGSEQQDRYGQRDYDRDDGQQDDGQQDYGQQDYDRDDRQGRYRQPFEQRSDRQSDQRQERQRDQQTRQRDQQTRQRDQPSRDGRQVRLEPQGWIRIAVDRDNDGQFDAVETIFMYDLEVAQQRSRQRQQEEMQRYGRDSDAQRRQDPQRDATASRDRQPQTREGQTQEVQGTIQELTTRWLPQRGEQPFMVARVRTEQGRSEQVLLGSRHEIRRLDLDRGDRISIQGRRATVNNQTMLVATQVQSDGETVRPQKQSYDPAQRYERYYSLQEDQEDRFLSGQDSSTQRYYPGDRDQQDRYRSARPQEDRYQSDRNQSQRVMQRRQQDRNQQDRNQRDRNQQDRDQQDRNQQDRTQTSRDRSGERAQQDQGRRSRQDQSRQDASTQQEDGSTEELEGEVVSTQSMRVPNREELQLIGNVRRQRGSQFRVHFGPLSKFENVDLEAGATVKVKARRGEVGGTTAWIAEEVEIDNQTISVDN